MNGIFHHFTNLNLNIVQSKFTVCDVYLPIVIIDWFGTFGILLRHWLILNICGKCHGLLTDFWWFNYRLLGVDKLLGNDYSDGFSFVEWFWILNFEKPLSFKYQNF